MQQSGEKPDIEGFMCAVLRGEKPGWPFGRDVLLINLFLERAEYHGVMALLHEHFQGEPSFSQALPAEILQACRDAALGQAMWELRHRVLLREVFERLTAENIMPLVFKGTALAYNLYPKGALRNRGDTDFLIPAGTRERTAAILTEMGFEREMGISGESVSYEASFTRSASGSGTHTLDVHWRINNSELLSQLFEYGELLSRAQPAPELGLHARAADPVYAMLIACMHRATHKHNPYYVNGIAYYGGDRLIWLYDIHLLAGTFTGEQWIEFVNLADEKGLREVCLEGLERAHSAFLTVIPNSVKNLLSMPPGHEEVARYFGSSALRQQWMDFRAIRGINRKMRFARETLFPSAEYMRAKYPEGGWLPWLYVRRAAGGIVKRFQQPGDGA